MAGHVSIYEQLPRRILYLTRNNDTSQGKAVELPPGKTEASWTKAVIARISQLRSRIVLELCLAPPFHNSLSWLAALLGWQAKKLVLRALSSGTKEHPRAEGPFRTLIGWPLHFGLGVRGSFIHRNRPDLPFPLLVQIQPMLSCAVRDVFV